MYKNISEGQYLIKLLGAAINNNDINYPSEDFDWDKLYSLSSFHSVANTAYYGIQKLPATDAVPAKILKEFTNAAFKSSATESLQHFEMRQIFQRFEQNQIFCVPLDGHVIKKYYPRPDMRYISTLILLIDEKDKNKIHTILNSLGFSLVRSEQSKSTYIKDNNTSLELCTSLIPERTEYDNFFTEVRKNVIHKSNLNFVATLRQEDFYIYTMAQLKQLYASGGAGIRSVLDVWVLLKRLSPTLDRDYINNKLNELNLNLFSYYMEEFSKVWFDEHFENNDSYIYDKMTTHIFNNYKSSNKKELDDFYSALLPNAEQKSKPKKESLFPPLDKMKSAYPILDKMPFLLPLYWLVRIVNLLVNKKQKNN